MRKVFIPSLPTRFDAATKERVPSLDLNPAAQYGELVKLVEGPVDGDNINEAIDQVKTGINDCGIDDYILCVGDVVLTAAAIVVVCRWHGKANILRWDRVRRGYDVMEVNL